MNSHVLHCGIWAIAILTAMLSALFGIGWLRTEFRHRMDGRVQRLAGHFIVAAGVAVYSAIAVLWVAGEMLADWWPGVVPVPAVALIVAVIGFERVCNWGQASTKNTSGRQGTHVRASTHSGLMEEKQ